MALIPFMLRRRSVREQKGIRIIRASLSDAEDRAEAMAKILAAGGDHQSQIGIAHLSAVLALIGLDVRAPESAWLSPDELRVLAWLAYAQREMMPPIIPCPAFDDLPETGFTPV